MAQTHGCKEGAVSLELKIHLWTREGPGCPSKHSSEPSTASGFCKGHQPLLLAQSQAQARGALGGSNTGLAAGRDVTAPYKLPESPAQGHLGSGSVRAGWDCRAWKGEWWKITS